MSVVFRRALVILAHLALWACACVGAYLLRFEGAPPPDVVLPGIYGGLVLLWALSITFWVFGLFHGVLRYAGIREVRAIVQAVTIAIAALVVLGVLLPAVLLPRSIYVGQWVLCILASSALRLGVRVVRERAPSSSVTRRHAVLIGAGDAGDSLLRDVERSPTHVFQVVCALDDSSAKRGVEVRGIPVLGAIDDVGLKRAIEKYGVELAVLAMPGATGPRVREIVEQCRALGLETKTLPSLHQIVDGAVSVSMLRDVAIEDLLRREPVQLDEASMDTLLRGRCVMITGGAGSIGSELARQALRYEPSKLVILDHNENGLFFLEKELVAKYPHRDIIPIIGDVRDKRRLAEVVLKERPSVVLHAAAHKHVPLMELNASQAAKNNILGTRNVADVASAHGVETFVLISTGKAVNPTSIMGATKRVAEMYVQALAALRKTRFVVVRFGNVLGSAGSVVQVFREQIATGGPVTVTHEDMTRYFMTIPEACQLVLQAGALAKGGEVNLLDMGQPVRIMDLANDMIRMSGYEPGTDIEVKITGARAGEKLHEELLLDAEDHAETSHPKIMVGRVPPVPVAAAQDAVARVQIASDLGDDAVRAELSELIPEAQLGRSHDDEETDVASQARVIAGRGRGRARVPKAG
jgi:FlaA1/EpsC-like NDP-sugar epimerase